HRHLAERTVHEVEPEQDAVAARAVDLAALERVPDRVAPAPVRVRGDEAAGEEERRLPFGLREAQDVHAAAARRVELGGVDDARPRGGRLGGEQPLVPGLVARAGRLGHLAPRELLVAGARARAVVVARAEEAELEAAWLRGVVEVRDRERVLHGAAGPVVEGRVEAVEALAAALPLLGLRPRDDEVPELAEL